MTDATQPMATDFEPPADELRRDAEDTAPVVGRATGGLNPVATVAAFGAAAVVLFVLLNGRREARVAGPMAPSVATSQAAWSPPALQLPVTPASAPGAGPFNGLPTQVIAVPPAAAAPPPTPDRPAPPAAGGPESPARLHAPAVVVDLGGASRGFVLAQADAAPASAGTGGRTEAGPPTAGGAQRPQLSDSEQFAKRVGEEEPDRARAIPMRNLRAIAPQGTIIPGVLETAIDSDLPGYTRAIVSRDVLSFDGRAVLIPRSSRLIGQYKSAVALGQTRAFIIWTRVIRPDGVSIQIASPGTDELGRGGLDGKVNRHFLRRFSGSILLSVLNAAVASVGRTPSTQISIGSPSAATGLANSAFQGDAIPPTIKVAQGQAINIFVARDLDFSGVEPPR
jgi:type IV secretion system protein VirB10